MLKRCMLAGIAAGTVLVHPGLPVNALDECDGADCAQIQVLDASVPINASDGTGAVAIQFTQAPSDGVVGQGADDTAAIAFSVGLGGGGGNPLVFECEGGRLVSNAVMPGDALGDDFALVVENESCNARDRCLCPEGSQTRDNFVNLVVYGPKNLPEGGPVEIPRLPSGQLAVLNLAAGESVSVNDEIDVSIFCEQSDASRPDFTANLSIGDQSAVDQTADRGEDRSRIRCIGGRVTITSVAVDTPTPGAGCPGDCDGNGSVNIGELIRGVRIALGQSDVSNCEAFDTNGDGLVRIGELIQAVRSALNGCP